MIIEGIVTTLGSDGILNTAPMGPAIDEREIYSIRRFTLRPFQTSRTFANLKTNPCGVFHVVDDVLLLAQATIQNISPATFAAEKVRGRRLADCCRFFEFRIVEFDESSDRSRLVANVVHAKHVRDFVGLNRAAHAVVEAAILASRVHMLPAVEILDELQRLSPLIDKTGGARERQAFDLLRAFVERNIEPVG